VSGCIKQTDWPRPSYYYLTDRPVCHIKDYTKTEHQSNPAERILRTADHLFYVQGFSATGVNQIISEAGVARASFYQYFPSKKDLAVAYLERRHEHWFAQLHERVATESNATARVLALFEFLDVWMPESEYRGCAFLNMVSELPTLGSDIQWVIRRHKSELREFIRDLVSDVGGVQAPEHVADTIHVLFEGAIAESQVMQASWPILTARDSVQRLLQSWI